MIWFLLACFDSPEAVVSETVSDPRAYVTHAWAAETRNWAGTHVFNPTDPELVNPLIDKAMKRKPAWKGQLPRDKRKLDQFVRMSQGLYNTGLLSDPAAKAAVEQRIRDRFEQPAIERIGDAAIADLGFAPGTISRVLRAGYGITDSPVIDRYELKPEHVVRAFGQLVTAHPDATVYQIDLKLWEKSRRVDFKYRYEKATDLLRVQRRGHDQFVSYQPLGGVDALVAGGYPTHTWDLDNALGEWRMLKPR
jgi:hypothetical protein